MKHKYELQTELCIEEEPSSREGTIHVRNGFKEPQEFQWETFNQRLRIIREVLVAPPKDWRDILLKWPNEQIGKIVIKQGVAQMKNKSLLVGHFTNNRIHGYGLMIGGKDRFYEGQFQNSCKHGIGYQSFPTGVYLGMYINNKPQGRGSYHNFKDQHYSGQFLAGKKNGYGEWKTPKEKYVGEWRADVPEGKGVIETDVSRYEGQVKAGAKHGQGKESFKNGDSYIGGYVNGRPDGFGEYVWGVNGAVFQGHFKNGLRHGKGIWTLNGDKYQGEYINDKKCGHGEFHWASGNYYIGEYFNDFRHGKGQMNWVDGSWYRGQWKYGIQHGHGELHEVGKPPMRGTFENNVLIKQEPDPQKIKNLKQQILKKTHRENQSQKKFPFIQKQQQRKHTASLINRSPIQTYKKRKYHHEIKATTQYISRSVKDIKQVKTRGRHYTNRNDKRKTDRDFVNKTDQSLDLIQWSNIYNLKTSPAKRF